MVFAEENVCTLLLELDQTTLKDLVTWGRALKNYQALAWSMRVHFASEWVFFIRHELSQRILALSQ